MNSNFFNDFLIQFMSIIYEALPFIVLGAIISGALEELLPQKFFARVLPKNRSIAIAASSVLGFFLPMCECGIVPVMRRLLNKGVPASCAITYMLSAPVINPIVLAGTAMAFSGHFDLFGIYGFGMVCLRAGMAFLTAFTIGCYIERLDRRGVKIVRDNIIRTRLVATAESNRLLEEEGVLKDQHSHDHSHCSHDHKHEHAEGEACSHDHKHGEECTHKHHDHSHCGHDHSHDHAHDHDHPPAKKRSLLDRLTAIADIAVSDFVDIAAFLVIGAAIASTLSLIVPREKMEEFGQQAIPSILLMMGLAVTLSLCSEADAFVAANMVGIRLSAKAAFLVLGPMFDFKLLIMYSWVFTQQIVRRLVLMLFVLIFALSFGVEMFHQYAVPRLWPTNAQQQGGAINVEKLNADAKKEVVAPKTPTTEQPTGKKPAVEKISPATKVSEAKKEVK